MEYTIDNLKQLRESEDHIEFKAARHNYPSAGGSKTEPKERRRCVLGYVVALANEGGGLLALGMHDSYPHKVVGTDFADKNLGNLVDQIYERLQIRVATHELFEGSLRVVVIEVPARPIGKMLKFEGTPLMRTGESLREMSDQEIFKILSEQEPDFSAKVCEGLSVEDLDIEAIAAMKTQYAEKQKNPSFKALPTLQVLSDLGLMSEGKLNYATLILLGKEDVIRKYLPQYMITVEYRLNHSMIPYTARKSFQQPLFIAIDQVWDYINQPASNPLLPYNDGANIFYINAFNKEAVREAILNACCHRSMKITSDVVIKQYPDSLTIINAGGFPLGVSLDNILTVSSTPRSKLMSEVLEKTGLVERSGQGVDKMFSLCIKEGKELPSFAGTDDYQVCLTFKTEIKDPDLVRFIKKKAAKPDGEVMLNVFELLTLRQIHKNQYQNLDKEIVDKLIADGLVVAINGLYRLNFDYTNVGFETLRKFDLKHLQIVSNCFKNNTAITKSILKEAFVGILTDRQIKSFIDKMEAENLITKEGKTRSARYLKTDYFASLL